jgi:hypothetical protein
VRACRTFRSLIGIWTLSGLLAVSVGACLNPMPDDFPSNRTTVPADPTVGVGAPGASPSGGEYNGNQGGAAGSSSGMLDGPPSVNGQAGSTSSPSVDDSGSSTPGLDGGSSGGPEGPDAGVVGENDDVAD